MSERALSCPSCLETGDHRHVESHGEYNIFECGTCGLQFCDPMESIGENPFSWTGRHLEKTVEDQTTHAARSPQYQKFFRMVGSGRGRLLDLGFGMGGFLRHASTKGFQVYGIDSSQLAVRYARETLRLENVIEGSVCSIPDEWGRFNAITAFEVLEHLDRPRDLLAEVHDHLLSHGMFFLAVPDADRYSLRVMTRMQESPPGYDYPPNHLTRWNRRSLLRFLGLAEWRKIGVEHTLLPNHLIPRHLLSLRRGTLRPLAQYSTEIGSTTSKIGAEPSSSGAGTSGLRNSIARVVDSFSPFETLTRRLKLYGPWLVGYAEKP